MVRFPVVTKPVGDRVLARQFSKLPRPLDARTGEVYAIERRVADVAGNGARLNAAECGYWKNCGPGRPDMAVSIFDLSNEEMKKVAPLSVLSIEDNRHQDLVAQHVRYHRDARMADDNLSVPGSYVYIGFWGGSLVMEESLFSGFSATDDLVPRTRAGMGFGFLWREVSHGAVQDAMHDLELLLGRYIADRLYPGIPEPLPPARGYGVGADLGEDFLF